MIDLDELHDKMVSYRLVGFTKSDISTIDALELLGRLEQAEKDAARYHELRDSESETCLEFINAKARMASPEWLDGMVDEYMKCSK